MKNFILLFPILLFLSSCGDDDLPIDENEEMEEVENNEDNEEDEDNSTTYEFYAKIDGEEFIAEIANHRNLGDLDFLSGSAQTSNGGHEINIALPEGLDPGNHTISSVSDESANYVINAGNSSTIYNGFNGEVEILENTDDIIRGTFKVEMTFDVQNPSSDYSITEGEFNLEK